MTETRSVWNPAIVADLQPGQIFWHARRKVIGLVVGRGDERLYARLTCGSVQHLVTLARFRRQDDPVEVALGPTHYRLDTEKPGDPDADVPRTGAIMTTDRGLMLVCRDERRPIAVSLPDGRYIGSVPAVLGRSYWEEWAAWVEHDGEAHDVASLFAFLLPRLWSWPDTVDTE